MLYLLCNLFLICEHFDLNRGCSFKCFLGFHKGVELLNMLNNTVSLEVNSLYVALEQNPSDDTKNNVE
jgi:hypothetical protein